MSSILAARAYSDGEVVFIAWDFPQAIPGCLGFDIHRIYVSDGGDPDTPAGTERVMATWVPFEQQNNPQWLPQDSSVWPVQSLTWRDLTVRRRRDSMNVRPSDVLVKYSIRPVAAAAPGQTPINDPSLSKTYTGDPLPLVYLDDGVETNEVMVTNRYGDITAAFNNGILSTQWLSHTVTQALSTPPSGATAGGPIAKPQAPLTYLKEQIATIDSPIRTYMSGDVLPLLQQLFDRASAAPGAEIYLALYELDDPELIGLIKDNASCVHLILSNTSASSTNKQLWDSENLPARQALTGVVAELYNRMFNNDAHIGHNKFAVLVDPTGIPQAVLTGSTNWTPNGLCAQSNNAILIDNPELAAQYLGYWNDLKADTALFTTPNPLTSPTNNFQHPQLRANNASPCPTITLSDTTTKVTLWRSPNTKGVTKGVQTPPDINEIFGLMDQAQKSIFFAVFLPSEAGADSVIQQAVQLGQSKSLMVYGTVSSPMAMPNYDPKDPKAASPIYDVGSVHVVRASALTKGDLMGDFESEILSLGNAIIHDKILILDPLSDNPVIVTGSHNLGYKASYANDDNLIIIQGNPALAQAYTVHVLDLYDHYRFRAIQETRLAQTGQAPTSPGKTAGTLCRDDTWQTSHLDPSRTELPRYFSQASSL